MKVLPVGRHALLVEVDDQWAALGLYAQIQRRLDDCWPGPPPTDVVPGARTVLLDGLEDPGRVAREIEGWEAVPAPPARGESLVCPTVYDGPDLDDVAGWWGMSRQEAIAAHTATTFYVAFCGFSPGFAYIAGLPSGLAVPRLDTPRPSVPAGTVALAGEYTAVYPRSSPGGWQLIGHTDLVMWDVSRDPPALLRPGMLVRFVEADA